MTRNLETGDTLWLVDNGFQVTPVGGGSGYLIFAYTDREDQKTYTRCLNLSTATLETLPNEIANLTFKQVYPEQIYETRYLTKNGIELNYDSATDEFSYEHGGNTYVYDGDVIVQYQVEYVEDYAGNNKIDPTNWPTDKIEKVGEKYWINETDLVYNTDGYYHINATSQEDQLQVHLQLHAQWKYLLVGKDGESHDYKMTEFATLVENMTYNMQNATLYELDADGIVNIAPETLNTKIITHIQVGLIGKDINFNTSQITPKDPVNGIVLGDLTVAQIMDYTGAILSAINSIST
jgi:hypothetical protein